MDRLIGHCVVGHRVAERAIIHLVNMDPPYNVKVEPRSATASAAGLNSFKHHWGADWKEAKKKIQLHHQSLESVTLDRSL